MFVGCLALAGFPFTAGFFSKDTILAAAVEQGMTGPHKVLYTVLGIVGLVTALLTSFYTFRLWFRVFQGPEACEMGDEHHAEEDGGQKAEGGAEPTHEHHHEPHEMPWSMNGPLVVLAVGAILTGYFGGWVDHAVHGSTAGLVEHGGHGEHDAHPTLLGMGLHTAMMVISSIIAMLGIVLAAWFHWLDRSSATAVANAWPGVVRTLHNKYYVDELYDAIIVRPLRMAGHLCFQMDRLIINGVLAVIGAVPRWLGLSVQPTQRGLLQGYGLGMMTGLAAIAFRVWMAFN